jgi:hypothetical protein
MPKAKPDQVVVHRIELQQHERESLDNFLIGKTVTNAVGALGSVLSGLGPAIGAIVAAYIAKEGIDKFNDAWKNYFTKAGAQLAEPAQDEWDYYRAVASFLMAQSSLADCEANINDLWKQLDGSTLVKPKFKRFVLKANTSGWADWQWGREAAMNWKAFYPPSELLEDAKGMVKDSVNPTRNRALSWLLDRYL